MGVAACITSIIFASLEVFLDLGVRAPTRELAQEQSLAVQLLQNDPISDREPAASEEEDLPLQVEAPVAALSAEPQNETPAIPPEPTDWQETITEFVATNRSEQIRREGSQSTMWRRTHSIMFKPEDEFVPREDPVLPNFRFKPQVRVAGLGFTVGSCFIGIPLVGVPVEERTVGVRLFVCSKG